MSNGRHRPDSISRARKAPYQGIVLLPARNRGAAAPLVERNVLPGACAASNSSSGVPVSRFGTELRDTQTRFAPTSQNHPIRGRFRDRAPRGRAARSPGASAAPRAIEREPEAAAERKAECERNAHRASLLSVCSAIGRPHYLAERHLQALLVHPQLEVFSEQIRFHRGC